MIVTEQEARTKWCPHARLGNNPGCNRAADVTGPWRDRVPKALCIASECMAWKWKQNHSPEEREQRKVHHLAAEVPLGYCGL